MLLLNGFFQSLQFMAYNTIAYADVPRPQMSTATSFYTTFQQMSLTLGIAMSAATLAASERILGHTVLMLSDFSVAFLAVATDVAGRAIAEPGLRPVGRRRAQWPSRPPGQAAHCGGGVSAGLSRGPASVAARFP